MRTVTIELEDQKSEIWQTLPPVCQNLLTNKALNAILNGIPYPTGADQLELAIELAENGVSPEVISKVSGLHRSVFEGFYNSRSSNLEYGHNANHTTRP